MSNASNNQHDHNENHNPLDKTAQFSLALTAGYIAAFPVNYILIGKGVRHEH